MRKLNAPWRRIESVLVAIGIAGAAWSQNTLGTLLNTSNSFDGYTLMAPIGSTETFLFDNCGRVVQTWESNYRPGLAAYLLPNGDLIRAAQLPSDAFAGGGIGGGFEQWDWEGNLVRSWNAATDSLHAHHDFTVLPNGNLLFIAWERHSGEEAIARGRDPELTSPEVWVTRVEERNAEDEVVWAWSVWDHLVQDFDAALPGFGEPSAHPGRIDVNFNATALAGGAGPGGGELAAADWLHVNAIDYHADLDQIALSSRKFDEIWIIDHGLTTEEAAGPAGDLLYRWGNPQSYGRGTEADRRFYGQHDVHWVGDNLLVFNNGAGRPDGAYSTVEEWTPPLLADGTYALDATEPYGPESLTWIYPETGTNDFYSGNVSGAQRLPGGTTLICEGARGRLLEVEPDGTTVWEYVNPMTGIGPLLQGTEPLNNQVFLTRRYSADFPGFAGRDLTPGDPLEFQPDLSGCTTFTTVPELSPTSLTLHPNPGKSRLHLPAPQGPGGRYVVHDLWGRIAAEGPWYAEQVLDVSMWPSGQYVVHTFGASPEDCTRTKWMKS